MAGALGLALGVGDAAVSLGTSGTVYAVSPTGSADPRGEVAGFADATGRHLPLVCTLNAAKVLDAVGRLLGVDHAELDRLALAGDAGGLTLLPYFDGERTPDLPDATGSLVGLRSGVTREQLARAAVEGVVCGLLDGLDALRQHAAVTGRVVLTGGASRSSAVRRVFASLCDLPVVVSEAEESVAAGACAQAAAVLAGDDPLHVAGAWGLGRVADVETLDAVDHADVRARYAATRARLHPDAR
jgi:xylulokinase